MPRSYERGVSIAWLFLFLRSLSALARCVTPYWAPNLGHYS